MEATKAYGERNKTGSNFLRRDYIGLRRQPDRPTDLLRQLTEQQVGLAAEPVLRL